MPCLGLSRCSVAPSIRSRAGAKGPRMQRWRGGKFSWSTDPYARSVPDSPERTCRPQSLSSLAMAEVEGVGRCSSHARKAPRLLRQEGADGRLALSSVSRVDVEAVVERLETDSQDPRRLLLVSAALL